MYTHCCNSTCEGHKNKFLNWTSPDATTLYDSRSKFITCSQFVSLVCVTTIIDWSMVTVIYVLGHNETERAQVEQQKMLCRQMSSIAGAASKIAAMGLDLTHISFI